MGREQEGNAVLPCWHLTAAVKGAILSTACALPFTRELCLCAHGLITDRVQEQRSERSLFYVLRK